MPSYTALVDRFGGFRFFDALVDAIFDEDLLKRQASAAYP